MGLSVINIYIYFVACKSHNILILLEKLWFYFAMVHYGWFVVLTDDVSSGVENFHELIIFK